MPDNPYLSNAAAYVVETIFTVYIILVLLRFLLQLARADFYNPLCQFLVKATNPPLRPLRRVVPGLWGIDLASVLLLIALQMLAFWLIHLASGRSIAVEGLFVLSVGEILLLTLNVLLVTIFVQVIMSWINPSAYNPLLSVLYSLNEPLLRPARRMLPNLGGIDLSPLVVLLLIQLTKILLVAPIRDTGLRLAYG